MTANVKGNLSPRQKLPKPTSFGYDVDSSQKYAIFVTIRLDPKIATCDNIGERYREICLYFTHC
jgi:hypothetical protein